MNKPRTTLDRERDFIGYGNANPGIAWPDGRRIAVQVVLNYEEGGENCILNGDGASEAFLSEIIGADARKGVRHVNMESLYEYGSRRGFWRLHRILKAYGVPVTVFGITSALEKNPEAVATMVEADWEIASHGLRWIDYQYLPEAVEWEHMQQAIARHQAVTGTRPLGWYTGRCSPNTRRLAAREGGFVYCADGYADDLPYWEFYDEQPLLIVPYTLDVNDARFVTNQGFNQGDDFFRYLKDSFDVLYREGETLPQMLSIGLHCRLAGRPGRAAALERFFDYVRQFDDAWLCRRIDIARHIHKTFPAERAPASALNL